MKALKGIVLVNTYSAEEIRRVVAAAHALDFEGPIADYRIVGDRIELWDLHGRHAVYSPLAEQITSNPKKLTSRKKKQTSRK